jgi:hypothetical protein
MEQPKSPKPSDAKTRVVTMDELNRLTMRLNKVTNFNFIGAILCMAAGIYYAQAGSELLPKIFIGVMAITMLLTILSYRASTKVSKIIKVVQQKKPKR